MIPHVQNYLALDDSTCSKLSSSALPINPATSAKPTSLYPSIRKIFKKKNIFRLKFITCHTRISDHDKLTGQSERDTKSHRGKFFLSICISVIFLHHCIERKEFKGYSTGVNFQIITSKGLRKNYCLDILRQKMVQGTLTNKLALICHSSAKRLALMLNGRWLLLWKVNQ